MKKALLGALLVAAVSTGCGSSQNDTLSAADDSRPVANVAALGEMRAFNARVFDAPPLMAAERPVVLVGEVDSLAPGRFVDTVQPDGSKIRENSIVVKIKISKEHKADGVAFPDGAAYVMLYRGVSRVSSDGKVVGPDANPSIAALREAIPSGTAVIVIATPFSTSGSISHPARSVADEHAGYPNGATLLDGRHPQAVILDEGDKFLAEWPNDLTYAQALDSLKGVTG